MSGQRLLRVAAIGVAGVLVAGGVAWADPDPTEFTVRAGLSGAREVPGPGDQNGSGQAVFDINTDTGAICFELLVRNIDPATMAHIHEGAEGEAGPIRVTLVPPTTGSSSGCVVDSAQAQAIAADPSGYYANVHNMEFPNGAVRGQLHGRPDRS